MCYIVMRRVWPYGEPVDTPYRVFQCRRKAEKFIESMVAAELAIDPDSDAHYFVEGPVIYHG